MTITAPPPAPPGANQSPSASGEDPPQSERSQRRVARLPSSTARGFELPTWLFDVIFLGALGMLALWGFIASFGSIGFWAGVIGMVLTGAWAVVTAWKPWRLWTTVLGALAVFLVAGGPVAVPQHTVAFVVPTPSSLWQLVSGLVTAWADILATRPPIGQVANLLVIPFFGGVLIGAVSLSVARRADRWIAIALVPPLAVFVVAILLGTDTPVSTWQGVVFALVAMYWAAHRQRLRRLGGVAGSATSRRLGTGLALLILVAAVGWLIGTYPTVSGTVNGHSHGFVLRDRINPPIDTRLLTSPLSDIRYFRVDHPMDQLFTVQGLPAGSLLRLASLDSYDGTAWRVYQSPRITQSTSLFERVGQSIPVQGASPKNVVTISIPSNSPYGEVWLPTAGQTGSISFTGSQAASLYDDVRYNSNLDTAAIGPGVPSGMTYTLASFATGPLPVVGTPGVAQVSVVPKGLDAWVQKNDGGATSSLAKMRMLASALSNKGTYSDGQENKQEAAVDPGHASSEIESFLSSAVPVGDAEQYAAALGLMGYELGIPDRVVVGVDCRRQSCNGPVTGSRITAWVEVSDGTSWVPLFPTPNSKSNPQLTNQSPQPPANTSSKAPPDRPVPPKANAGNGSKGSSSNCGADGTCASSPFLPAWVGPVVGIPFSVFLFIALIVGGLIGLKASRRKKRRTLGAPAGRVVAGWDELCDLVRDTGGILPLTATRRESAILVDRPGVATVAQQADTLVFGPNEVSDQEAEAYWDQLETTRQGILGSLSFWDRWKAQLSLSSLQPAAHIERVRDLVTTKAYTLYKEKLLPLGSRVRERFRR